MHSNRYIFMYAAAITLLVAVILSFLVEGLGPRKEANEALAKKKDIISSVISKEEMKAMDNPMIELFYSDKIQGFVVDSEGNVLEGVEATDIDVKKESKKDVAERKFPLFVYSNGDDKSYVLMVRGNGLWDEIWGFVALAGDKQTIQGVNFGHAGETPGLGAEIKDNQEWKDQFKGKSIIDKSGQYVSVVPVKGIKSNPAHQVDGLSGATITADGVGVMMVEDLADYLPYLNSVN